MSGGVPGEWSAVQFLNPGSSDEAPKTQYAPGVVGYANSLYCVWVGTNQSNQAGPGPLRYSIRGADGTWSETAPFGQNANPEKAMQTPALAVLEGYIHAVYPDENHNLIHMQFDTAGRVWGRRSGLAVSATQPASVAAFQGKLFCVYRNEEALTTSNLFMTWWTTATGWQKPVQIQNVSESFQHTALFELDARLQLLVADHATKRIKRYVYTGDGGSWEPPDLPVVPPQVADWSGVSTACVYNRAFLATISSVGVVLTTRLQGASWASVQSTSASPIATPSIAVLDNRVYCIWNEGPSGALRWMRRDALEISGTEEWMTNLADNKCLSQLTIPGTHDAAAISHVPFVGCHTMTFTEQLNAGVRYFDLRAGFSRWSSNLIAYHGFYAIQRSLDLRSEVLIASIFQECYVFLTVHPKECIIIQIKQDWNSGNQTEAAKFATAMQNLITKNNEFWLTGKTIPTLQELRGKIQLVRRFPVLVSVLPFGIDATQDWLDNVSDFQITNPDVDIHVQDHYMFDEDGVPDKKYGDVLDQLGRARPNPNPARTLYLNFASATSWQSLYRPSDIALGCVLMKTTEDLDVVFNYEEGVNEKLATFFNNLKNAELGGYGIILMDYPQEPEELILAMIKSNF
ncbi:hypothetical protein H2202_007047 [Exophiala xenobiotica]|nr:hypothetical protein H2202_007047 [Exophiala xenobiotica]KAK5217581.1 hypothetical protein LTR72_009698 [Exophiala xenobiotica]KAK5232930.1 hypothetical protein LTR47_006157 [Exophiala xenobiotica]KAK5255331.1 hypothetical protein LTS06_000352 [Exophiala xenobiotica]KAK5288022.1 hypothetical protein LTR14_008805 [Exophiala xenobiotica]